MFLDFFADCGTKIADAWDSFVNAMNDEWTSLTTNPWNYILKMIGINFSSTATVLDITKSIVNIIIFIFGIFLLYRTVYIFVGFFFKAPKYEAKPQDKKFACVVSARNEEAVIGNLIDSMFKQTYPKELIRVYLVADNCTDNTAKVAREHGAIVYERFDTEHVSKGFGLQFLFENIKRDYGIDSVDYYAVFDADNLLNARFFEEMNNCLQSGFDAAVSFRNIKNFGTNIISAGYGMHFYRNTLISHRPRAVFKTATNVTGTGYVVHSKYLMNGWHYTNLTEDAEFTTVSIAEGMKIGYCEAAEIYDEQPTSLKVSWRQRLRWRKGGLINYVNNAPKLFKAFFKTGKFACYDMYWQTFPYDLFSFFLALFVQIFSIIFAYSTEGYYDWSKFLFYVLGIFGGAYISAFFLGFLIVIKERKHLHCNFGKLVLYLFTWPLFDTVSIIIAVQCLFMRVKWKPIVHNDTTSIEDIENIENKDKK